MLREDLPPGKNHGHLVVIDESEYAHVVGVRLGDDDPTAEGEMLTWSTDLSPEEMVHEAALAIPGVTESLSARVQFVENEEDADWAEGELHEVLDYIRPRLSHVALLTIRLKDGQELRWRPSAARLKSSDVEHGEASIATPPTDSSLGLAAELMFRTATEGLKKHKQDLMAELRAS